jgi:hypothetical protein
MLASARREMQASEKRERGSWDNRGKWNKIK